MLMNDNLYVTWQYICCRGSEMFILSLWIYFHEHNHCIESQNHAASEWSKFYCCACISQVVIMALL